MNSKPAQDPWKQATVAIAVAASLLEGTPEATELGAVCDKLLIRLKSAEQDERRAVLRALAGALD